MSEIFGVKVFELQVNEKVYGQTNYPQNVQTQ